MKNPTNKSIWFKTKRYGWGWTPASWQGWLTGLVFVLFIIGGALWLLGSEPENATKVLLFIAWVAFATLCLVIVSYKKGEKPGWHWGDQDEKHDK